MSEKKIINDKKLAAAVNEDNEQSEKVGWWINEQFIVKKPDEEITRILQTTENQGRHILAQIKPDKTLYNVTKIGEGTKSTYRVVAVS